MRSRKILPAALALCAIPLAATAQQLANPNEVVNKIVAQEQAEVQLLRQYAPLVETYIQYLRPDKQLGAVPNGDKYFLGRAVLDTGIELEPLEPPVGTKGKLSSSLREFFSTQFVPRGFLQMIYLDTNGFDLQHYKFEYVRREFLGEVRCLVFDVYPLPKSGKGRFLGRIWVEDQDYHIVRFNGAYGGASLTSDYFNFDSWRSNAGKNLWVPSFIYSAQGGVRDRNTIRLAFRPFKSQTRLWGYNLGNVSQEQESSQILIETPVHDETKTANDLTPLQAQRAWDRQAEDNAMDGLERIGLLAPSGEIDKVLDTVVSNLELTNNLEIDPEVRCRILMTSTFESFSLGHTIVLSRGLIDVLPDEASLAAILAHELAHVLLGNHVDSLLGFFDVLQFLEKDNFRHFDFSRPLAEEEAAKQKGIELLRNSPYQDKSATAQAFLQALNTRSQDIPNLISPHLGNRVPTDLTIASAVSAGSEEKTGANIIAALPLGGRIKIDPWNDQLRMLNSKPVGQVAESEKMPFEITPFSFYLTRQGGNAPQAPGSVAAKLPSSSKPK